MKKWLLLVILCTALPMIAWSQFNFVFVPELYGRQVDGLGVFKVQNLTGAAVQCQVLITVQETGHGQNIVSITTPVVTFPTGVSDFPPALLAGARMQFGANAIARLVNQTRSFPAGDYTYCFRLVTTGQQEEEYENCYDATMQPLVPLTLLYPADDDRVCDKRPVLSWQPPVPYDPSMLFRLLLTEKKRGEAVENLIMNTPLVLLDNITTTSVTYPAFSPALEEGKTYVWQVVTHQQGVIVSRSEIWEFTVQCVEQPDQMDEDSYRQLKLMANGNYYIAKHTLKFAFQNDYHVDKLTYAILDIARGAEKVTYTPEVPIGPGLNKINIDLGALDLRPGGHYLLKVYPFNEPPIEVRFIYKGSN